MSECEKRKEFWQDPDFGPTKDDEHGSLSIYYTGETPRGHAEVDEITWARPATYLADDNDDEEEEEWETGDGLTALPLLVKRAKALRRKRKGRRTKLTKMLRNPLLDLLAAETTEDVEVEEYEEDIPCEPPVESERSTSTPPSLPSPSDQDGDADL